MDSPIRPPAGPPPPVAHRPRDPRRRPGPGRCLDKVRGWFLAVSCWQNWAGNQAATPKRVITPRSAEEVAEAVTLATQDGLTVRMTGSGHSFTGAAVTDGIMLRPGGMGPDPVGRPGRRAGDGVGGGRLLGT